MKGLDPLDPNYDGFEVHSSGITEGSPPGAHPDSGAVDGEGKDPLTFIHHAALTIMADANLAPEVKARDMARLAGACRIIARAYSRLGRDSKAEKAAAKAEYYLRRAHELGHNVEL